MTLVLAIVAMILLVVSRLFYRDHFAPPGLFALGWILPLAVSQLELSTMQEPLTPTVWIMVLGSSLLFLGGCLAVAVLGRPPHRPLPPAILRTQISGRRLRAAMVALFLLAVVAFAYEVRVAGTIPILAPPESAAVVYRNFPLPFVHYGTVSAMSVAVLAFLHLRIFGRAHWQLASVLLLGSTALIASILARQQILLILVGCVLIVHYTSRRGIRLVYLGGLAAAAVAFFVFIGETRGGTSEFASRISGTELPSWATGLVWPYLYLAVNFTVFQFLSRAGLTPTFGANTLQPLLSFTFTRRLFPVPNVEEEFGWFNTTTYLWPLYSDFGILGTLVVPLIYGFVTTWWYTRFRSAPSATRMLVYLLFAFSTLFTFQGNGFAFPPYYIFALQFWLVLRWAERPMRAVRASPAVAVS